MAEQDSDLSESATPYKLEQARKKGSVAKSADFTAVTILSVLAASVYALGWEGLMQTMRLERAILTRTGNVNLTMDNSGPWLGQIAAGMLQILAPLFAAITVTAIIANIIQTGPVFSTSSVTPDLSRIDPAAGLKRLFSMRIVYETFKSIFKLVILSLIAYTTIKNTVPGMMSLSGAEPKGLLKVLVGLTGSLLSKLIFALLVIAILDFCYTRWEFQKRMRMSKRDVKDESKNRDGDPRIRARLRELRQETLKRSKSMKNLPSADVLITNPTHLAVALSYDPHSSAAPKLVAKGAGDMAANMRALARKHNIPVVENKLLARAIYKEVECEGFVPEKHYAKLAKIMVWAYVMRESLRPKKTT